MKAVLFAVILFFAMAPASAQEQTEKISVSGNCGMCKKKIEKAATAAGASYASWDNSSKVLTVKYDSKDVTALKVEQAVAKAGYDTKNVKATDEAYNGLHDCCKYERATATTKEHKGGHDMKCEKGEKDCNKKDCCKKQ